METNHIDIELHLSYYFISTLLALIFMCIFLFQISCSIVRREYLLSFVFVSYFYRVEIPMIFLVFIIFYTHNCPRFSIWSLLKHVSFNQVYYLVTKFIA